MITIAAVVEGYGDVQAVPSLVSKTAAHMGLEAIAPRPIRAGEWKALANPGVLERYLELAASRDADSILVILDLDDGCPVSEATNANNRINLWLGGRSIHTEICFLAREYETLFLHDPQSMGTFQAAKIPVNPDAIRGAKEAIKTATGTRYRETQHQLEMTRALNVENLLNRSRSARKLASFLERAQLRKAA